MHAVLESWVRSPYDGVNGELVVVLGGSSMNLETRMDEWEWDALVAGSVHELNVELQPWPDERGVPTLAAASDRRKSIVVQEEGSSVLVFGEMLRFEAGADELWVDAGLPGPVEISVPAEYAADFTPGQCVSVAGVLYGWISNSGPDGGLLVR